MKKGIVSLVLLIIIMFVNCTQIKAQSNIQEKETQQKITTDDFDFSDVQQFVDSNVKESEISFKDVINRIINGELSSVLSDLGKQMKSKLFFELEYNKDSISKILLIAIISAFFTNFSMIFSNANISETGFYITYMLLITVLFSAFLIITSVATGVIEGLLEFMKILLPTYFLSVGVSGATSSALVFYEITLVMITGTSWLCTRVIVPLVNVYVVLRVVNSISKEDFLSKTAGVVKTIIEWLMKTGLGLVLGVNVIQGMVMPTVDAMKNGTVGKLIGIIPGIGGGASTVTEILLGSGKIIKNGIGAAAVVIVVVICLIPIMKMMIFALVYQVSAAVVQPVADKRVIEAILAVSDGAKIFIKVVAMTIFLFIVTIAIVCVSTNISY